MKKIEMTPVQARERMNAIEVRLNEIQDLCEKEERQRTDAERTEFNELKREYDNLDILTKMSNIDIKPQQLVSREVGFDNYIKAVGEKGIKADRVVAREVITTSDINGQIPLTIGDIIKPLEEGLILNKVGIKLRTGLVGEYASPVLGRVVAKVAGEKVKLANTKISTEALKPKPFRVGITTQTTYSAVNRSAGLTLDIVREELPMGVTRTLNALMFSPVKVATDASGNQLPDEAMGPFAQILSKNSAATPVAELSGKTKTQKKSIYHVSFTGGVPTYKELLAMKGLVLAKGVVNDGTACFVMSEYLKAELEGTPRDAGSGLMVVENGMIAGIPVFCTNEIDTDTKQYVGFGIWSNQLLGQFGDMRYVVDPTSLADEDSIKHTLNGEWAMSTVRKEAFVIGSLGTAAE